MLHSDSFYAEKNMTNHKCKFNGNDVCDWCGRIKGLTLKESETYKEGLRDDYQINEELWWKIHEKIVGGKK